MNRPPIKNHLTLEDRQIIEKLRKQGKSYNDIASAIGFGRTTIRGELKRCKKNSYNAQEAQKSYEETWEKRRLKYIKIFSDEDLEIIHKMIEEGAVRASIRRRLGCSFVRIEKWFAENAPHYKGGSVLNLEKRLQNIEMQLEILLDIIKQKT